jgi:Raf kinase inhibitor-like YbhB/YbcL family protein
MPMARGPFAWFALLLGMAFFAIMQGAESGMALTLTSPAFKPGAQMPSRLTCEGDDRSPPLAWSGVPKGTESLALIIDDPDAPDPRAPKRVWVHWVIFNLSRELECVAENADKEGLPAGAARGLNDARTTAYSGPCPPIGSHRYFHKLYALDDRLDLERPTKADLEAAMQGHVLAQTELIGTYQKGDR